MHQIEQCPHCGKITLGFSVYDTKRQAERTGEKMVIKKVLIFLLTPLILTILGPFGTFFGFILACFIGYHIDKTAQSITDSIDLGVHSSMPFEFKCPHCGNYWKRTYEKGVDFTTDTVLKWQKITIMKGLRKDADSNNIYAVIYGIVAAACAYYCFTHESSSMHTEEVLFFNVQVTDYNWTWWFLCFIGVVTLYNSISRGIKCRNQKQEAENLEKMSVSSFRHSNYRAGNPFVGVVRPLDKMDGVSQEQQRMAASSLSLMPTTDKDHKRCPYCGEEILSVAKKCKYCGEWLNKETEQLKEMTRCSVCGEIVEKDLEKCPLCNEHLHPSHIAIEEEVSTKECMFCGETILEIAHKCKHCGEWQKGGAKEMIRCSVCGEKVEKGQEKCPYCHEHLYASHLALDIEETTKPCLICGEQILEVAKKCKHCGEWLNNETHPSSNNEVISKQPEKVETEHSIDSDEIIVEPTIDSTEKKSEPVDDSDVPVQAIEKPQTSFKLTNWLFYVVIPIIAIIAFCIAIIIFHSNYVYTYWWMDEEQIIIPAIVVFVIILGIYYFIVHKKISSSSATNYKKGHHTKPNSKGHLKL